MAQEFRPDSADALREIVAGALADETPLRVVGADSKAGFGHPLDLPRLRVDGLSGISSYEPEELVMTAAAGTPMAEIEACLADNRQQLAFEPADYGALLGGALPGGEPGRGTLGGVLACNLSGPRRIKAGAARDHFLGVQAVTGRGELIKAGGRVVKNVTGYDLCKLLAGSFGTLAVMTEVSVKVLPAAEETLTLLLMGSSRRTGSGRCGRRWPARTMSPARRTCRRRQRHGPRYYRRPEQPSPPCASRGLGRRFAIAPMR